MENKYQLNKTGNLSIQDIFLMACFDNNKILAKWLWEISKINKDWSIDIHTDNDIIFKHAFENNYYEICEMIYNLSENNFVTMYINKVFENACRNNNRDIIGLIYNFSRNFKINYNEYHNSIDIVENLNEFDLIKIKTDIYSFIFKHANGNIDIIDSMMALSRIEKVIIHIDINNNIDNNENINEKFKSACRNNGKEAAEFLYNLSKKTNKININYNMFKDACENNCKDIAELLYDLSKIDCNEKIDLSANDEYIFRRLCEKGCKDMAEFIYNLSKKDNKKININIDEEYPFYLVCYYGHEHMVEWLYNLSKTDGNTKININLRDEDFFRSACEKNYIKVAEILYSLSKNENCKINIHACHDDPFILACTNGNRNVAEFLYNLSKIDNNAEINNNILDKAFIISCTLNRYSIAEWLSSIRSNYKFELVPYINNKRKGLKKDYNIEKRLKN